MAAVKVNYFNASKQYQEHAAAFNKAANKILASGQYILGESVQSFERKFSKYSGTKYGVGVGSGTDALIFALKSLGVTKGDEVILPSFTFVATAYAVIHNGATPVFADIDPITYTLDPVSVERLITKKTKCILPVHLYGQCADMGALNKIARRHKVFLVEDAAQAHGAKFKKKKAGSMGDTGCFSFYPTKNLGAFGDGGMVLTNSGKVVSGIQTCRNLGRPVQKGDHVMPAWTSRLDAIQAALLEIKLKSLDTYNKKRRKFAAEYFKLLKNTPLILPEESKNQYHVYHLFVVRVPARKRDQLQAYLAKRNIPTLVHYSKPVHKQPAYTKLFSRKWQLPVTERISKEILSLPLYPEMSRSEVVQVCKAIKDFYS